MLPKLPAVYVLYYVILYSKHWTVKCYCSLCVYVVHAAFCTLFMCRDQYIVTINVEVSRTLFSELIVNT